MVYELSYKDIFLVFGISSTLKDTKLSYVLTSFVCTFLALYGMCHSYGFVLKALITLFPSWVIV